MERCRMERVLRDWSYITGHSQTSFPCNEDGLIYAMMFEAGHSSLLGVPLGFENRSLIEPLSDRLQANGDPLGLYIAHWLIGSTEYVEEAACKLQEHVHQRIREANPIERGTISSLAASCRLPAFCQREININSRVLFKPTHITMDTRDPMARPCVVTIDSVTIRNKDQSHYPYSYNTLFEQYPIPCDWDLIWLGNGVDLTVTNQNNFDVVFSIILFGHPAKLQQLVCP